MTKWEYLYTRIFLTVSTPKDVEVKLDEYGELGWEIIKMDTTPKVSGDSLTLIIDLFAKRPKAEKQVIL
jgi:hypothetical protein